MGSESEPPPPPAPDDDRFFSSPVSSWQRSVKRKLEKMSDEPAFITPSRFQNDVAARVEIENECSALRETLASQQQTIQELYGELEEERSASASATNEAMSMILRLQREKAEIQMDARQFKRFAEEKMTHDQQEFLSLEDLLYKRDQAVRALACEVQAYRHRLMSYGFPEAEINREEGLAMCGDDNVDRNGNGGFLNDYPSLRCTIPNRDLHDETDEKYAQFGEIPRTPQEHLQNLERRIGQLEKTPSSSHLNVMDKGVVAAGNSRRYSMDSAGSFLVRETVQDSNGKRHEEEEFFPVMVDRASESGSEGLSDRVYTIDAVHGAPVARKCEEDNVSTPREPVIKEEADVKKLYMRLQALEADRESMRQEIISMSTDKAQLVLLKEIAQHLCKEVPPSRRPERRLVKKPSFLGSFSIISAMKWIVSFFSWKKKSHRSKYTFGLSNNNMGLLLLLEKSPSMRHWRCLTRAQG